MTMTVMIAGGGTGGHLFPGVALAEELRRRAPDTEILFVGTERGIETRAIPKAGFDLELLPVSGLRRTGALGLVRSALRGHGAKRRAGLYQQSARSGGSSCFRFAAHRRFSGREGQSLR